MVKQSSSQKTYRLDFGKLSEQIGPFLLKLTLFCSEAVEFGRGTGRSELTLDIAQLLPTTAVSQATEKIRAKTWTYRLCRRQSRF